VLDILLSEIICDKEDRKLETDLTIQLFNAAIRKIPHYYEATFKVLVGCLWKTDADKTFPESLHGVFYIGILVKCNSNGWHFLDTRETLLQHFYQLQNTERLF